MKSSVIYFCFFSIVALSSFAADQAIDPVDNTTSVLRTQTSEVVSNATTTSNFESDSVCLKNCPSVSYSHKRNISPCATTKSACLSYCEKTRDACCNVTARELSVEVPICAPACPTKETVTRSRDGKRAVYDYGRYEAVVRADKDGNVNVKYRKRILDR
jgi:hypothetical protein